jgi:S1-C subfamily serine protease
MIDLLQVGDQVVLKIQRGSEQLDVTVTLAARP